jgi:outer membrane protein assembly factor BamB
MRRRRIEIIAIVGISTILLAMYGTPADRHTSALTLYRQASPATNEVNSQVKASQKNYQPGGATSAVSTATEGATEGDWPMLAANPQRTSWTPEEVRGQLRPVWYRVIDPYISHKTQIIAANNLLYVSTARGLYALHTGDNPAYSAGELAWVYPTELPLGHSPTVVNGVVYVGGYDRKIHAIVANPDPSTLPTDSTTGYSINDRVLWTFEAGPGTDELGAGFETNPLVVNGTVYAGNRDGYMYAIDAATGNLKWRYKTDGPILFSAAYKDGMIYFASNDAHAYALNANNGSLVWKSQKLPGAGFHSYWPVVYKDWVIFGGAENYRMAYWSEDFPSIGTESNLTSLERDELYPNHQSDPIETTIGPQGTEPGDWVEGTVTIDASQPTVTPNGPTLPITEYFEQKPWRRTYFVLDRLTGEEFTFDSDSDSRPEYAPFPWAGTHSGNRYPPVIGGDGVLYQYVNYLSNPWITQGNITGWKFGTPFISRISSSSFAVDEPQAYSAGGNLIYWTHFDSQAGAYDISVPMGGSDREWTFWPWDALDEILPGYDAKYFLNHPDALALVYGSANGVYEQPSTTLIPYRGKVYLHRRNAIIALGDTSTDPIQLSLVSTVDTQESLPKITTDQLKQKLAEEVQKILDAGHLRPGYHSTGIWDPHATSSDNPGTGIGDYLIDYFHNPSDTLYTLARALPYLPPELQQQTRTYLQQEFAAYPPYDIAHIGWADGESREIFDIPPDIQITIDQFSPRQSSGTVWGSRAEWWFFPQYSFYGLWKYAQEFGNAREIFNKIRNKLETPPSDDYLAEYPHIHNAYIAGYIGYLELEKMAGEPESANVRAELNRLMNLRATSFSKDAPQFPVSGAYATNYKNTLNIARNFMYLVPELADYLYENAYDKVQEAVNEYSEIAPGWFVSKYDATYGEGVLQQLYDYHSLFQAKALILREPREELVKYLDVPAFARGDLFYIQNLIATIEAPQPLEKTASPTAGGQGMPIVYTLSFFGTGSTLTLTDTLPPGLSAPGNFELVGTSTVPTYDSGQHRLTWSDTPPAGQNVIIRYTVTITTSSPQMLINTAQLSEESGEIRTATATVLANSCITYLPLILKDDR